MFRNKLWGAYLFWLALVLLTAQGTGFRADAAKAMNWPIALMLTPWGLIQNLVFGAHEYLHKVYFQAPPGHSFAAQDQWYWHYLQIYLQSNLLEVLPLILVWPRWRPTMKNALRISILNSVTHPIVFFGLMRMPFPYLVNILIAESFAILTEGYCYRRMGLTQPWLASLWANLISWQLAPFLTVYFFLSDKMVS